MCNIDTEEVNSRHKSINSGTRRPVPAAIQYVQLHPLCSPITSFVVCLPLNVPVISTGWTTSLRTSCPSWETSVSSSVKIKKNVHLRDITI